MCCLPALAYAALLEVLGARVDAVVKDLEVYAEDEPPPDFGLDTEVEGILREADVHGFEPLPSRRLLGRRRLVACLRRRARRTASEPGAARTGLGRERSDTGGGRAHAAVSVRSRRCRPTSSWPGSCGCNSHRVLSHRRRPRAHRRPGWPSAPRVFAPSSTPSTTAISTLEALRAFDRPVYFALGGRSNPDYYARMAERLAAIFPDFTLETFAERHHFDPPHRTEPERLGGSLLALWERAEA